MRQVPAGSGKCQDSEPWGPREHVGVPGQAGFLCACRLDQTQLSEEVTEMLRALEEEKPRLLISNRW